MTNIPVWWRQQRKRTDDYGLIKDIPGSIITLLEKHFSLLIISVPWDEPRVVPASESLPTSLSFHRLSEVWFSAHWRLFLSAGDTIDKWDLCRLRIETSLSRQGQNQSSSWRTRRATQLNGWTEITSLCSAHFFMLTLSAASSLDWERCEHNALGSTVWWQHPQAELLVESHWTTGLMFSSSSTHRTETICGRPPGRG